MLPEFVWAVSAHRTTAAGGTGWQSLGLVEKLFLLGVGSLHHCSILPTDALVVVWLGWWWPVCASLGVLQFCLSVYFVLMQRVNVS